jgi:hypothetical protein
MNSKQINDTLDILSFLPAVINKQVSSYLATIHELLQHQHVKQASHKVNIVHISNPVLAARIRQLEKSGQGHTNINYNFSVQIIQ